LDIDQFTEIINVIVDHHNNLLIKNYPRNEGIIKVNVDPYPNNLWHWGVENRSALRECSSHNVIFHLLPKEKAVVTLYGIRFQNMDYTCTRRSLERLLQNALENGKKEVTIAYDRRDTQCIYLLLDNGQTIESCFLLERDKDYSFYLQQEIRDLSRRKNKAELSKYGDIKSEIVDQIKEMKAMIKREQIEKRKKFRCK
jgi:putative transposase